MVNCSVVVLGNIGMSPRMRLHAKSLSESGYIVHMYGYDEDSTSIDNVHIHRLTPFPKLLNRLPSLFRYPLKALWCFINLTFSLLIHTTGDFIMVQNPPCIPVFTCVALVCKLKRCRMIIDWHNYGYTILALQLGVDSLTVHLAAYYERVFARFADLNICVSSAMKRDLAANWHIEATVLHDRPAAKFGPISAEEKRTLFDKLAETDDSFASADAFVVLTSTSWTPDERLDMLFDALQEYETIRCDARTDLPHIHCVITGKGPLKAHYIDTYVEPLFADSECVRISTPWLSADDYPTMVAAADVGVSLHSSSSGLDLPMKVVDMFGCGVPVLALDFLCIRELVKPNRYGLIFSSPAELAQQLVAVASGDRSPLAAYRRNLDEYRRALGWHEQWRRVLLPLLESLH